MNTDQLIESLVAEVKPVRQLVDPRRRAAVWTAVALVCVVFGILQLGLRRDAAVASQSVYLWARLLLLASTMWLAVTSAFRLAVPGHDTRAWRRWWPMVVLGVLVALTSADVVIGAIAGTDLGSPLRGWACMRNVAIVGALPAVASVFLIWRAAPVEPQWSAVLGVLASGAAGALAAEIHCPIKAPLHILLWHMMPVVASIGLGLLAGGALLWRIRAGRR